MSSIRTLLMSISWSARLLSMLALPGWAADLRITVQIFLSSIPRARHRPSPKHQSRRYAPYSCFTYYCAGEPSSSNCHCSTTNLYNFDTIFCQPHNVRCHTESYVDDTPVYSQTTPGLDPFLHVPNHNHILIPIHTPFPTTVFSLVLSHKT